MHVQRARFTFESTRLFDSGFGHSRFEGVIEGQLSGGDGPLATLGADKQEMPTAQINHADCAVSAGQGTLSFPAWPVRHANPHAGPKVGCTKGDQASES